MSEIKSNIKSPIYLNLDITGSKTKASRNTSGCCIFDVHFANNAFNNISTLSFKNYFCAYITIKFRSSNKNSKWKMALESHQLMIDPHSTMNAEDVFIFVSKDFKESLNDVFAIRFILQQPSCLWKEFNIKNICLYSDANTSNLNIKSILKKINSFIDVKNETNDFNKSNLTSSQESLNEIANTSVDIDNVSQECVDELLIKMKEMSCLPLFQQGFIPTETYVGYYDKDGFCDSISLIHPL